MPRLHTQIRNCVEHDRKSISNLSISAPVNVCHGCSYSFHVYLLFIYIVHTLVLFFVEFVAEFPMANKFS